MQFSLVNCLSDYLNFKEFCERANFPPRGGATVESFSVADGLMNKTLGFDRLPRYNWDRAKSENLEYEYIKLYNRYLAVKTF